MIIKLCFISPWLVSQFVFATCCFLTLPLFAVQDGIAQLDAQLLKRIGEIRHEPTLEWASLDLGIQPTGAHTKSSLVQLILESDSPLKLTNEKKELIRLLHSNRVLRSSALTTITSTLMGQPYSDKVLKSQAFREWYDETYRRDNSFLYSQLTNILDEDQLRILRRRTMANAMAPTSSIKPSYHLFYEPTVESLFPQQAYMFSEEELVKINEKFSKLQNESRERAAEMLDGVWAEIVAELPKAATKKLEKKLTSIISRIDEINRELSLKKEKLYAAAFEQLMDALPKRQREILNSWSGLDGLK